MSVTLVNRSALDDLRAAIGPEKLARLLDRFTAGLDTALRGEERGAQDVAQEAHTLISMSGMLGCEALSQACRHLELAAKAGGDFAEPLAEARALRDRTAVALRTDQGATAA